MKRMIGWLPFTGVGRLRTRTSEFEEFASADQQLFIIDHKTSEKNRKGSVRRCNAMHRSGSPRNRKRDKAKKSAGWMPWH